MSDKRGKNQNSTAKRGSSSTGIFITILILVVIFGGFLQVSSRAGYCSKCHEMQPFTSTWSESSHANISCKKCHYSPGANSGINAKFIGLRMHLKKWTQSYSGRRPVANMQSASCATGNCHPLASLQDVIEYENVSFSHQNHLESSRRGTNLVCTSCHSEIAHGELRSTTHGSCFLCHLRPIEGTTIETSFVAECTLCHNPPAKIIKTNGIEVNHLDETTSKLECTTCHHRIVFGKGIASESSCLLCHADSAILEKMNDVAFLHTAHITERGMSCSRCHEPIEHSLPALSETIPADCASCHPNHHEAETLVYNAHSFSESENYGSAEFISHIDCNACHITKVGDRLDIKGVTYLASAQSCSRCHISHYGNFLEEWKGSINRMLAEVRAEILITKPKIDLSPLSAKKKEELKQTLDDAEMKLLLVQRGKSVHNIQYSDILIRRTHDRINQVLSELGGNTITSERMEAYRLASKEECNPCHFGIADHSSMFGAISFSHLPHLSQGKLPCASCHEYESRWQPHGKLRFEDAEGCKRCHGEDGGCGSCHTGFESTPVSVFGTTFIHKSHSEENGLRCVNCHYPESSDFEHGQIQFESRADCVNCHHGPEQEKSCTECHDVQAKLQSGRIPFSDDFIPNNHKFSCDTCHDVSVKHSRAMIGKKCEGCHDANHVKNIDEWLDMSKKALIRIENLISRAGELGLSDKQADELKNISERVRFLSRDSSPGVHNPGLWNEILTGDTETLREWLGEK